MKRFAKQLAALGIALMISLTFISVQAPGALLIVSAHSGKTDH